MNVSGYSLTTDSAGNVLATGSSNMPLVTKFDPGGNRVWDFRPAEFMFPQVAATDASGNVYVTGTFDNTITLGRTTLTSLGNADGFLLKLSPGGEVIWAASLGGNRTRTAGASPSVSTAMLTSPVATPGNCHRRPALPGAGHRLRPGHGALRSQQRHPAVDQGVREPECWLGALAMPPAILPGDVRKGPVDLGAEGMVHPESGLLRFKRPPPACCDGTPRWSSRAAASAASLRNGSSDYFAVLGLPDATGARPESVAVRSPAGAGCTRGWPPACADSTRGFKWVATSKGQSGVAPVCASNALRARRQT
jgi:hypothetical protein